jgi:tRNA-binding EMAP/Myf-like protein
VRRGLVREVLGLGDAVLGVVVLEVDVGVEGDLEVVVGVEEEEEEEDVVVVVVVVVEGGVVAAEDRDTMAFLVSYHDFLSLLVLTRLTV